MSRMRKKNRRALFSKNEGSVDRVLVVLTLGLILFGSIMVFSASAPYAANAHDGNAMYYFFRNLLFAAIGTVVLFLVSRIDYRVYQRHAKLLYGLALLTCVLVFVPHVGQDINDSRRWISIGSFSFMPSDILKIGAIIGLSAYLCTRDLAKNGTLGIFFRVMFFIGMTILPVAMQPNFSAVVVISASLIFIYILGGMRMRHLGIVFLLAIVGLFIAFFPYKGNYRLDRLLAVIDPMKDPLGRGWQLLQSLYAVSSGGLFGVGLGQGRQKFDYLAEEAHNDFIFSVICEELGFVGATLVLLAFVILLVRMARASASAKNNFGKLLGYGITFIVGFQMLVNIGVAIGLVPPTGITLPFISYGGSSLVAMCVMMGIVLNLSRDEANYDKG